MKNLHKIKILFILFVLLNFLVPSLQNNFVYASGKYAFGNCPHVTNNNNYDNLRATTNTEVHGLCIDYSSGAYSTNYYETPGVFSVQYLNSSFGSSNIYTFGYCTNPAKIFDYNHVYAPYEPITSINNGLLSAEIIHLFGSNNSHNGNLPTLSYNTAFGRGRKNYTAAAVQIAVWYEISGYSIFNYSYNHSNFLTGNGQFGPSGESLLKPSVLGSEPYMVGYTTGAAFAPFAGNNNFTLPSFSYPTPITQNSFETAVQYMIKKAQLKLETPGSIHYLETNYTVAASTVYPNTDQKLIIKAPYNPVVKVQKSLNVNNGGWYTPGSMNPVSVPLGSNINFRFTINNVSNSYVTVGQLVDNIHLGIGTTSSMLAFSGYSLNGNGNPFVSLPGPYLAPEGYNYDQLTVFIDTTVSNNISYDNQVECDQGYVPQANTLPSSNIICVKTYIPPTTLTVSKTLQDLTDNQSTSNGIIPVFPGDTLNITIPITNTGGNTAYNVNVVDNMNSIECNLFCSQTHSWTYSSIPNGDTVTEFLTATIPMNSPINVEGCDQVSVTSSNSASVNSNTVCYVVFPYPNYSPRLTSPSLSANPINSSGGHTFYTFVPTCLWLSNYPNYTPTAPLIVAYINEYGIFVQYSMTVNNTYFYSYHYINSLNGNGSMYSSSPGQFNSTATQNSPGVWNYNGCPVDFMFKQTTSQVTISAIDFATITETVSTNGNQLLSINQGTQRLYTNPVSGNIEQIEPILYKP